MLESEGEISRTVRASLLVCEYRMIGASRVYKEFTRLVCLEGKFS